MKKDELFDLITEFKPDDAFVEEALGEREGAPVRVYAGSSKKSPMRIAAPIAACLAVAAAAGFLVVNVNRDKLAAGPAASIEESSEVDETNTTDEHSEPEVKEHSGSVNMRLGTFMEKCYDKVGEENPEIDDWTCGFCDIDFDGEDDFLLCAESKLGIPQGKGIRVFKQGTRGEVLDLGTIGARFDAIDLENIYLVRNEVNNEHLYFINYEKDGKCVDDIQRVVFDESTDTVREESYLRLVKNTADGTMKAFRNNVEITVDELLNEWNSHKTSKTGVDYFPLPNVSDPHGAAAEYVQLLVDKYNVPSEGDLTSLHRTVKSLDINNDGEDETIIAFRNCAQLRGMYVFSSDGELIGELDNEGERGEMFGYDGISVGRLLYDAVYKYEGGGESYYYFFSAHSESNGNRSVMQNAINKIVVNEDGTLSTEKITEQGYDINGVKINRVYGEDVSLEEWYAEAQKYKHIDEPFIW